MMHFHPQMTEVRDAMYKEVVAQGWYRARPDRTRRAWTAIGVMAVLAAAAVTALLAATVGWGLVGLALVAGGLALVIGARWMPARTAKGSGVLTRALGFAVFIRESEANRAQFAEKANLFTEYLPYAVALGCTERWARAFAGLAVPPPTLVRRAAAVPVRAGRVRHLDRRLLGAGGHDAGGHAGRLGGERVLGRLLRGWRRRGWRRLLVSRHAGRGRRRTRAAGSSAPAQAVEHVGAQAGSRPRCGGGRSRPRGRGSCRGGA